MIPISDLKSLDNLIINHFLEIYNENQDFNLAIFVLNEDNRFEDIDLSEYLPFFSEKQNVETLTNGVAKSFIAENRLAVSIKKVKGVRLSKYEQQEGIVPSSQELEKREREDLWILSVFLQVMSGEIILQFRENEEYPAIIQSQYFAEKIKLNQIEFWKQIEEDVDQLKFENRRLKEELVALKKNK